MTIDVERIKELSRKNLEEKRRLIGELIEFGNVLAENDWRIRGALLIVEFRMLGLVAVRNVEDGDYYIISSQD